MTPRRPQELAFLRDLALSLPAYHLRRQRAIVGGAFVPVPVLARHAVALEGHRMTMLRDERPDPWDVMVWR